MYKAGILPALLLLVLGLTLATSADARHRRHHHDYGDYNTSGFSRSDKDAARAAPALPQAQARTGRGGTFGAVIARLIRGCAQQAEELAHLPFEAVVQIVGPDERQRGALDVLRAAAAQAAQRLSSDCPRDVPAAPSEQLDAVAAGLDAGLAAFAGVQPALEQLYASLDDEQKARLLRDMTLRAAPAATADSRARAPAPQLEHQTQGRSTDPTDPTDGHSTRRADRDYLRRRPYDSASNRTADSVCILPRLPGSVAEGAGDEAAHAQSSCAPASNASPNLWADACEDLAAALRGWPIREIERDVRLTEPQRIGFYEFVTSSLKAAHLLASACPADGALTAPGRMAAMRARLHAVKAATTSIRPAFTQFYESLDQGQRRQFAPMR